jgi:hypothetical protein
MKFSPHPVTFSLLGPTILLNTADSNSFTNTVTQLHR